VAETVLRARGLCVDYAGARGELVHALCDVDLDVVAGETLAVVGESGSGKSTLLLALAGLLPRNARVRARELAFRGRDLCALDARAWRELRGREIGVVFQDPLAALDPVQRVGEQVGEALRAHRACPPAEIAPRVRELLRRAALADPERVARSYPHELSGGMRQRALVAAALALSPALCLADEPTSALDATLAAGVLRLLRESCRASGTALVLVTHDLALARAHAERTVVFRAGALVEQGPTAELVLHPREAFTQALVEARRRLEGST
jgi:ABC-type glutathione transport system ATPase component